MAKPRTVFVNSMADLFHARVALWFIREVFEVMRATPQHTYQILTKRSLQTASPRSSWSGPRTFGWGCRWKMSTPSAVSRTYDRCPQQ